MTPQRPWASRHCDPSASQSRHFLAPRFEREPFFRDHRVAGRPIVIPEDGLTTMQGVYVQDVARAAILAAEKDVATGHA